MKSDTTKFEMQNISKFWEDIQAMTKETQTTKLKTRSVSKLMDLLSGCPLCDKQIWKRIRQLRKQRKKK